MISSRHSTDPGSGAGSLAALRRFTRARPPAEYCELCSLRLAETHPHLLDAQKRTVTCACDTCALLFCGQQSPRYLRIPRRVQEVEDPFSDLDWEALTLPIQLAFFVRHAGNRIAAMYPSPAGVVESLLPIASHRLPVFETDVEALLVNRIGNQHGCYIVPIDECFRLTGLIRLHWRGLSGGPQVWIAIGAFFDQLAARASHA